MTGYNPEIATVSAAEFAELMALAREQPRLTPDGQWRHDYHAAMIAKRTIGVQPDLFGAKPIIHMHRTRPGPVIDWQPEPVGEKLDRIARRKCSDARRPGGTWQPTSQNPG